MIPKEGSFVWFDTAAIPADAPHPGNAHAFLEARIRDDPAISPPDEIKLNLHPDTPESPGYKREASRAWTGIKTGQ